MNYLTKELKMHPTHNVGTFLWLLKWFSDAQHLYPNISKEKFVGCLFSDTRKNQIIWNYDLKLFEDEIYNTNKARYRFLHTYTEAKGAFILYE